MKLTIEFLHLEHTESLDQRIKEKSEKINKYFDGNSHLKWNCYVKDGQHHAELHINCSHNNFHAKAHSDNLYKSLDIVVDRLEKQISKKKSKVKNKLHRSKGEKAVILDPEQAWLDYEDAA